MARRGRPGAGRRLPAMVLAIAAVILVGVGAGLSGLLDRGPGAAAPGTSDGASASPATSPSPTPRSPLPTVDAEVYWRGGWLPSDYRPAVARAGWLAVQSEMRDAPDPETVALDVLPAGLPVTIQAQQGPDPEWLAIVPDGATAKDVGWVPAAALSDHDPGRVAPLTMDVLDPELAAYLERWSSQVGVAVVNLSTGRTYGFNEDVHFITASSVKVPMMLTLLRQLEAAGRRPTAGQINQMTLMIERSDNTAASQINAQIGDRQGLIDFAVGLELYGFRPGSTKDSGWGWATITPATMARLLVLFEQDEILADPADQALARALLGNIISSQRIGVGTTAPRGATVMMKNGWVPGPDGLWVFNSSGIVTTTSATWVVAAYTAHNASLSQGQSIVINVCRMVASALT